MGLETDMSNTPSKISSRWVGFDTTTLKRFSSSNSFETWRSPKENLRRQWSCQALWEGNRDQVKEIINGIIGSLDWKIIICTFYQISPESFQSPEDGPNSWVIFMTTLKSFSNTLILTTPVKVKEKFFSLQHYLKVFWNKLFQTHHWTLSLWYPLQNWSLAWSYKMSILYLISLNQVQPRCSVIQNSHRSGLWPPRLNLVAQQSSKFEENRIKLLDSPNIKEDGIMQVSNSIKFDPGTDRHVESNAIQ